MNSNQLFIHRINALRRIISNRSSEELLELSGILRQLLMDSTPLVHVVNREFREKLIFVVAPSAEERNKRQREKIPDLPLPGFSFSSIIPQDERIDYLWINS